jgi:hypothetical protein
MNRALEKTIEHWGYLLPYAHIPRNESDYHKLLDFVESLMQVSSLEMLEFLMEEHSLG